MQRLSLIDHGLQRDRVRNEFIVNDGFLLICGVVGPKMTAAAKGQMLGESVVSLDLGRTLMHGATQGVAHYPFQQVRCAHRFSKFLQGERETIARAVAVDTSQHGRRSEDAAMDSQRELHKLRVMLTDQRPVDRATEHRIDASVVAIAFSPIQLEFPPPTNPWHELNAEQVG